MPLRIVTRCSILVGFLLGGSASGAEKVRFNRDVRPILSNNCFFCHGPDEKKREAKLRLDTREGALAEHDGTRAVVPGKPDESELLVRILSHDKDDVMPPPKAKKPPLTEKQIATLRTWIEQGAEYEAHWAFMPLAKTTPPEVKQRDWPRNVIDQFILARLEKESIAPSPAADAATLCRRMYLDLLGLLPTPDEVSTFTKAVETNRQAAVEALADKLLASPHYGERWGRHWLDQARYADSNGYSIDSERAQWPYRDWVIKAINDDMPFDRFTIEQLAGDLLPGATKSQLIASAFHRNTLINEEGGVDKEQFRNEAVADRVNTTGAVWLGLTVGCAQCHTHKYDPIPHREYYELFAFFNSGADVNNKGATIPVTRGEVFGNPVEKPVKPQSDEEFNAAAAARQADWERTELAKLERATPPRVEPRWQPAKYLEFDTATGAGFELLEDNSLLSDGRGAFNDTYRVVAQSPVKKIAAVRLRVLTHDSLPNHGPGMAQHGNFVLTEFEATLGETELQFSRAIADHEQPGYPASAAIDDKPKSGWAINVARGSKAKMNADHEAIFVLSQPVEPGDRSIEFKLHHDLNEKYLIGRFAIDFAETAPQPPAKQESAFAVALKTAPEMRKPEQAKLVRDAFEKQDAIIQAQKKRATNPNIAELMVMKDLPTPRETFIHIRGDFLRHDEKTGALSPGGLSAVPPALPPAPGRTRVDLAKWLISRDNPLTPRVTVNRVWMRYFGRGIVETEEDFGAQGTAPTHPELLDWLARNFIERGYSMKKLHRLIVTSATYQQSSKARPDLAEKDPRNLLLARQDRVRVEAEIIRDAALSASGLLDPTIGGPSVRPPQPEGVYAFTQNSKKWTAETGPARFRRALYTQFYRSAPYPLFSTFDSPDFQTVCTRRGRSDTPLQALTVANDQAFFEIAQGLAARLLTEVPGEDVDARLRRGFALCLSREPSAKELEVLRGYFDRQRTSLEQDNDAARKLTAGAVEKTGAPLEIAAATVCAARTLLNTDAFITRE